MISPSFKIYSFVIWSVFAFNLHAQEWHTSDLSTYIDNRIQCENKLQKYKWSQQVWPESNSHAKPKYEDVVDLDELENKVLKSLKKEQLLFDYFGVNLTARQYQNEINRIVKSTKDPKKLSEIFKLFNNNLITINECLIRAQLIDRVFQNNFNWDNEIHESTKNKALDHLNSLKNNYFDSSEHNNFFEKEYRIEGSKSKSGHKSIKSNKFETQLISQDEWNIKVRQLKANNLKLKDSALGFSFEFLTKIESDLISTKVFYITKQSSDEWLNNKKYVVLKKPKIYSDLILSKISPLENSFNKSSPEEGYWLPFDVPVKRTHYSTVWTGSEFIVWGGLDGTEHLNTGGRYDPVTNNWVMMSGVNGPSPRYNHTAVWTGSEMIVWGGRTDSVNPTETGGRYNPITDQWDTINLASAPVGRYSHSAIWTGTEMIVWGGIDEDNNYEPYDSGWAYDPTTASWQKISSLFEPPGLYKHSAVWNGSEMIIWDGTPNDIFEETLGGKYSSTLDEWSPMSHVNAPPLMQNINQREVLWADDRMLVWHGEEAVYQYLPIRKYSVTVNVVGLEQGNIVGLINNGSDPLIIDQIKKKTFSQWLNDGDNYQVTVNSQPENPDQTCIVNNPSGVINEEDVQLQVICTIDQFNVGGQVYGLAPGSNLTIQNNSMDDLIVSQNGVFVFSSAIDDTSSYDVTVSLQPTTPSQYCSVINGFGYVDSSDVTNVEVYCSEQSYRIGGNLTGLKLGNALTIALENNQQYKTIIQNGYFEFPQALADGTPYEITIVNQPGSPSQTCQITNAAGIISGDNIIDIDISCQDNTFSVGGVVSGLSAGTELELQINGNEAITIMSNGFYSFSTTLTDLSTYDVSILSQPQDQTCQLQNETGTINGNDVTNIFVDCVVSKFYVGGYVNGLLAGNELQLQNNQGEIININQNGLFSFSGPFNNNNSYSVTILTQPENPIQLCNIYNASGVINYSNIDSITAVCDESDDLIFRNSFD